MRLPVGGLIALLIFTPVAGLALDASPGLWELTTRVDIPKLPFGLTVPTNLPLPQSGTRSVCVTKKDVKDPRDVVRMQTGCQLETFDDANKEVIWTATCQGPPRSRSRGKLSFKDEALAGTAVVNTDIQGFELPVSLSYHGRRAGECQ